MPPRAKPKSRGSPKPKRKRSDDPQSDSDNTKEGARKARRNRNKIPSLDQTDIQEVARTKEAQGLKIEEDLHRTLIGSFRMPISSLDFQWKGEDTTNQRRVSTDHVKKMLTHFYTSGLKRCAKEHHIAAIINRQMFDEAVQSTVRATGINPIDTQTKPRDEPRDESEHLAGRVTAPRADSEGMTEDDRIYEATIRYPFLVLPAGVTVEAQSGQHRVHALRQLFTEERDKWWVVDLYDDSIGNAAKEKLRMNILELHKTPTLAETWANLLLYQRENDQNATDATLATMKSPTKVKQLLFSDQYRDVITQALRNRGVWKQFTGGRFGAFLPMRCVEENVRYLTRAAKIWDYIGEGIPGFHESIDEATLKHLEGLAPARFVEDARAVEEGMEGKWFPKIADKKYRSVIKSRLHSIDYRILSLNTFWEDIKSMSYFSRVMADVAFWLTEDFSASVRAGSAAENSLATTFQVFAFKPPDAQLTICGDKLVPLPTGDRLPDNIYRARAYTDIWLFVVRNFFSLHKALDPKPNDSGVEPLPWVISGVISGASDIEGYNNRFCIPEWRQLWEFSKALGFPPVYAETIGIGPQHCKLPMIPLNPEAISKSNDMRKLSDTIASIRPNMAAADVTSLCSHIFNQLPLLSADELQSFGEACPRTESLIQRTGALEGLWLPSFHQEHEKIDYSMMTKTPGPLEQDAASLSWFVKRDFIWSFLRPFPTVQPIFIPREGPWPPPSPKVSKEPTQVDLCDDAVLGAYMYMDLPSDRLPRPAPKPQGRSRSQTAPASPDLPTASLTPVPPTAPASLTPASLTPASLTPASLPSDRLPRPAPKLPGRSPSQIAPDLPTASLTPVPRIRPAARKISAANEQEAETRRQRAVKAIKSGHSRKPDQGKYPSIPEDEDGELCE